MAQRPRYSIGKPGLDDNRTWEDVTNLVQRSEVEKIELAVGAPIPESRKETAFSEDNELNHL